jgi:MFS family permease
MQAMRARSVAPLFFMHLMTYSSFLLVVALWGGPYLTHVYGYGLTARGNVLFVAVVAQIAGSVIWGWADQWFGGYKQPVLLGAGLTILALAAVAFFGILPEAAVIAWFTAIGFFTAYVSVLIAHGKSLFPPALVGRGITILNMGTMGGAFLTQTLSGFVIDLFPTRDGAYALDAYRLVFALQAVFLLLACAGYLRARDPRALTQTPQ